MKIFGFALLTLTLLSVLVQAQEQTKMSRSAASRRAYPGGRDDTDLTVQTLKQTAKHDADGHEFEEAGPEYDAPEGGDAGFGE